MEKTERIQYQAALAITDALQSSCRSKLYDELGWESLSECRWCWRILKIHKFGSSKTLKTSSHDSADHCTGKVIVTPFMN